MKIETRPLSTLNPAPYNPRVMSQHDRQALERSIREFGLVEPIVINSDGTVIGGHQRLEALKKLGHTDAQCVVVDLPKPKEKALNLALNRIRGDWDYRMLHSLLSDLQLSDVDLSLTGFSQFEIGSAGSWLQDPTSGMHLFPQPTTDRQADPPSSDGSHPSARSNGASARIITCPGCGNQFPIGAA